MGLESVSFLDDLVATNPVGATDPKSEGDDHIRNIKTALKATFPGMVGAAWRTQAKTTAYTLIANDNMSIIKATSGTFTLTLTAAATIGNDFMAIVHNLGSGVVTVDGNGAETINGWATIALNQGDSMLLWCDGSNWQAILDKKPTRQILTSGTGATYTTPGGVKQLIVKQRGGGGGGSGSGTTGPNNGTAGSATSFNSVDAAGGGTGSSGAGSPGTGGSGGSGSANLRIAGVSGSTGGTVFVGATPDKGWIGGDGGASPYGGLLTGASPSNSPANSGAGGTGGGYSGQVSTGTSVFLSYGGGQGEYVEQIINNPATTYTYTIGAGGTGGSAGTSGTAGANGGSGVIIVEEIY